MVFDSEEQKQFFVQLLSSPAISIPIGEAERVAEIVRAVREGEVRSADRPKPAPVAAGKR
ncbi:MAG: hypothetical protein DIU52_013650 [bacterium]